MKKLTCFTFSAAGVASFRNINYSVRFGKYVKIVSLLLLLGCFGNNAFAYSTTYYYPTSATAAANATYCVGQTPVNLTASIATTGTTSASSNATVQSYWYYNTTGATGTLTGATLAYAGATYTAGSGAEEADLPAADISTTTTGTFYYFLYVSYSGGYYYGTGELYSNNVTIIVDAGSTAITGPGSVCPGATIPLTDATTGGTWSSSNTAIATVGTSGVVDGVASGTATITYTSSGGCPETAVVTVDAISAISGTLSICTGTTTSLSNSTAGTGTWSSSNTTIATVGASTGLVTGGAAGTSIISYTSAAGCSVAAIVTVNTAPILGAINGINTTCIGLTTSLTDTSSGGVWSSSNTTVATVSGGMVTGAAAGSATISYTVTNICGTETATVNVIVSTTLFVSPVTGTDTVCPGFTDTLADPISGGAWTCTNTSITTIDAGTGIVAGIAPGSDTVIYTVTNSCGTDTVQFAITTSANCNTAVANTPQNITTLKIFPNPNAGAFTVTLSSDMDEEVQIAITNIVGEKVKQYTTKSNTATDIQIDPIPGIYLISASTKDGKYVTKVVVE